MNDFDPMDLLDRPIAFQRSFVKLGCGITGALLLSQAVYWSKRTNDGSGWFYKTAIEWEDETGLSVKEQQTARKRLKDAGLLLENKRGVPCKIFYRVDYKALFDLLGMGQTRMSQTAKLEYPNQPTLLDPSGYSSTEITTENTTENTTDISTTEKSPKRLSKLETVRQKTKGSAMDHVSDELLLEWIKHKKSLADRVLSKMVKVLDQCAEAGISASDAIVVQLENGWQGFESEWVIKKLKPASSGQQKVDPNNLTPYGGDW